MRRPRRSRRTLKGSWGIYAVLEVDDDLPEVPEMRAGLHRAMGLLVGELGRRIRRNASGGVLRRRTGQLATSIMESVAQDAVNTIGAVSSDQFHGRILETGARPHVIMPRQRSRRRVLRISTGFRTIFRRRVQHPGIAATHWFSRGVAEGLPAAKAAFDAEIERTVHG